MKDIGILNDKKIGQFKGILGMMENNPKIVLNKIDEKEKNFELDFLIKLFSIILYFNVNYYKERIPELLANNKINIYLFQALIDN